MSPGENEKVAPRSAKAVALSIIIPCWRDCDAAFVRAEKWSAYPAVSETIIAGVQSAKSQTKSINAGKIVFCAAGKAGRGIQLNEGARRARGDILLFHHVDSELTEAHLSAIADNVQDGEIIGGAFYRKFDERHPSLRWLEGIERWHSRAFGTLYGDQSVFVRRELFWQLGGFAAIPLMEDVEFSKRLRCAGKIALLDPPMSSSPQRQMDQGSWRVTFRNLFFLVAFRGGVSPQRLHAWYYGEAAPQPNTGNGRMTAEIRVVE